MNRQEQIRHTLDTLDHQKVQCTCLPDPAFGLHLPNCAWQKAFDQTLKELSKKSKRKKRQPFINSL